MVDLDPAECVRHREVDDFDDRFVLVSVALKSQLVARPFSGGPLPRRLSYRDAVRQPLGHSERIGNEREDFVDWRGYAGGIRERDRSHGPSVGIRYIYFEAVLRDNNIGKDFLRLFDQLIRADRIPSRDVRQNEPLGLRGESDLRGFFGGRMPGVARAIALFLAEGCFVNQQIGTLPGIHGRCAWPGVARECDEPARPCTTHDVGRSDGLTVGQRHCFTLGELPPKRSFGNSQRPRSLDVEPTAPHVLFEDVSERWPATVFGRKRKHVVPVPLPPSPFPSHRVPGFYFVDLDGKRHTLDTELHGGAQDLLRALGTVQKQRLRPPLETERSDQSNDAQEMIGVKVREKDLGQRKADAVAHHLALGAFAALEQERLAFAVNGEAADVPFDCWPGGGGAEESDG